MKFSALSNFKTLQHIFDNGYVVLQAPFFVFKLLNGG